MARVFSDMAMQLDAHWVEFPRDQGDRLPTEFVWRDPSNIPPALMALRASPDPQTSIGDGCPRRRRQIVSDDL